MSSISQKKISRRENNKKFLAEARKEKRRDSQIRK